MSLDNSDNENFEIEACGCIQEEVNEAIKEWKNEGKPEFTEKGITEIFEATINNNDFMSMSKIGKDILVEVLYAINFIYLDKDFNEPYSDYSHCLDDYTYELVKEKGNKPIIYAPTFVQKYYSLNWNQAMVILHSVEITDLTSHGSGQRVPFLNNKGVDFLKYYENKQQIANKIYKFVIENDCS